MFKDLRTLSEAQLQYEIRKNPRIIQFVENPSPCLLAEAFVELDGETFFDIIEPYCLTDDFISTLNNHLNVISFSQYEDLFLYCFEHKKEYCYRLMDMLPLLKKHGFFNKASLKRFPIYDLYTSFEDFLSKHQGIHFSSSLSVFMLHFYSDEIIRACKDNGELYSRMITNYYYYDNGTLPILEFISSTRDLLVVHADIITSNLLADQYCGKTLLYFNKDLLIPLIKEKPSVFVELIHSDRFRIDDLSDFVKVAPLLFRHNLLLSKRTLSCFLNNKCPEIHSLDILCRIAKSDIKLIEPFFVNLPDGLLSLDDLRSFNQIYPQHTMFVCEIIVLYYNLSGLEDVLHTHDLLGTKLDADGLFSLVNPMVISSNHELT